MDTESTHHRDPSPPPTTNVVANVNLSPPERPPPPSTPATDAVVPNASEDGVADAAKTEPAKTEPAKTEPQQTEPPQNPPPPISVKCVTFNVNGKSPKLPGNPTVPTSSSSPPLFANLSSFFVGAPDVYVFAFQELDLATETLMLNLASSKESIWCEALETHMSTEHNYRKLQSRILVGMLILVYVKQTLKSRITNVLTSAVGTGAHGLLGNKGAVCVRFDIDANTSVCFVNTHLAAHQAEVARRNEDVAAVLAKAVFWKSPQNTPSASSGGVDKIPSPPLEDGAPLNLEFQILMHDNVFWLGDLNYRVDDEYTKVVSLIKEKQFSEILKKDQLTIQRENGTVFQGFSEGPITFAPSYKFTPGTVTYDETKARIPSWCDRILFSGNMALTPGSYESHETVLLSDHLPVSAMFEIKLNVGGLRQGNRKVGELVQAEDRSTVHKRVTQTVTDGYTGLKTAFGSMSKSIATQQKKWFSS